MRRRPSKPDSSPEDGMGRIRGVLCAAYPFFMLVRRQDIAPKTSPILFDRQSLVDPSRKRRLRIRLKPRPVRNAARQWCCGLRKKVIKRDRNSGGVRTTLSVGRLRGSEKKCTGNPGDHAAFRRRSGWLPVFWRCRKSKAYDLAIASTRQIRRNSAQSGQQQIKQDVLLLAS